MVTKERMERLLRIFSEDPEIVEAALCLLIDQLQNPASQEGPGPEA